MGKDDHDDRVGFIEFAHHESAKDAKAARGHLVMNERRLRIEVWQGYKKDRRSPHDDKRHDDYDRQSKRDRQSPDYRYEYRSQSRSRRSPPRESYRDRGRGERRPDEPRGYATRPGIKPDFEFPRDEAGRKRTHLEGDKFFPGGRAHRPGEDFPPEDDPGATRSLFLGNLDRSLNREDIYSEFEEYGDILECDIKQARNANHSNFGFVKYLDLNMAWKAKLAMNGKVLHRNAIRVGWGRPVPSKVLWVGGLGPEVTTTLLQRECSKYGSIYNIKKNENCDWAEVTFQTIDSVTYAISALRGKRLPGSERRCRVDYAFTQEGAEKIGTFSSLSAYHERRARESGSLLELHSALGDCWEGELEIKKQPISARFSLIAGDQKRFSLSFASLSKMSIKQRLTFNHKLANSMSEKAKQGKVGAFLLITKGRGSQRSIKSLNQYFQLTNSVGLVYVNSEERISMFIYPASSWTEGIISSYAPLLAGRLKGSVYMLAYVGYLPTEEYQKHKKAAAEDKLVMAPSSVR